VADAEGSEVSAQNGRGKAGMPLATLLAQPAEVDSLDLRTLHDVLDRCHEKRARVDLLERRVLARLRSLQADQPIGDRLLDIEEAAAQLSVTKDWLRRRPTLPFVVKLSEGVVRYSVASIARFIATRQTPC
jgi:hypothetical protein